jgi:hypothetical protein
LGPHGKPALIGAAFGLVTSLVLRRLVKSLLMTVAFAAMVYFFVAYTTDWLDKVDIAQAGREAVEYAKAHRAEALETAQNYISTHLASSLGFAAGLLGGFAIAHRRLFRPSTAEKS